MYWHGGAQRVGSGMPAEGRQVLGWVPPPLYLYCVAEQGALRVYGRMSARDDGVVGWIACRKMEAWFLAGRADWGSFQRPRGDQYALSLYFSVMGLRLLY